ncbi:hypothetical protein [Variovorax saccharolyticus]|uniref:hypothetical protein n=1 Tax=Variovorax saccharolyticus TaxID=3053516 RepID=UPI0025768B57|nr:hypothetical protein [Variovorax sp. J31P216]MDM0029145.1 hypothetical protein [Variovorax sp. J31P216]
MDRRKLIAQIVERTGVKLDADDPAFLLVELNHLAMEGTADEVTRRIELAASRFDEVTTRNVDNFVGVANEALAKFIHRTNEIKAVLDALEAKTRIAPVHQVRVASPVAAPEYEAVVTTRDRRARPRALIHAAIAGVAVGAMAVGLTVALWPVDQATVGAASTEDPGATIPASSTKLNRTGRSQAKGPSS